MPDTGHRLPVGASDGPPKRPYRPTTRDARRALDPEAEAVIRAGAERIREIVAWEDTVDSVDLKR